MSQILRRSKGWEIEDLTGLIRRIGSRLTFLELLHAPNAAALFVALLPILNDTEAAVRSLLRYPWGERYLCALFNMEKLDDEGIARIAGELERWMRDKIGWHRALEVLRHLGGADTEKLLISTGVMTEAEEARIRHERKEEQAT